MAGGHVAARHRTPGDVLRRLFLHGVGYRFRNALHLLVAQHRIAAEAGLAIQDHAVVQADRHLPVRVLVNRRPAPLEVYFGADAAVLLPAGCSSAAAPTAARPYYS